MEKGKVGVAKADQLGWWQIFADVDFFFNRKYIY